MGDESTDKTRYLSDTKKPFKETAILGISAFFVFTSYSSLQNLQSSLNQKQGLGVASLACVYGAMLLNSFATPAIIYHLGIKVTITMGWIVHCIYIACNFYPQWWTLIPASLLLGLVSCPLWTSIETFMSALTHTKVKLDSSKGATLHGTFSRINGLFFAIFTGSQLSGNVLSSLLFSQAAGNHSGTSDSDVVCGAEYCSRFVEKGAVRLPNQRTVYTLLSVYLVSDVIGLLVTVIFLPNLQRPQLAGREIVRKLKSYWNIFLQLRMWLLVPLFGSRSLMFAVVISMFTKDFIGCALGINMVGYLMAGYASTTMVSSGFLGFAARYIGRQPLCAFALITDAAILSGLLLWRPQADHIVAFVCLAMLMGLTDGLWKVQMNALIIVFFPTSVDSAFSVKTTWSSFFIMLSFILAIFLCPLSTIYLTFALLTLAIVGYCVLEVWQLTTEDDKTKQDEQNKDSLSPNDDIQSDEAEDESLTSEKV